MKKVDIYILRGNYEHVIKWQLTICKRKGYGGTLRSAIPFLK